MRVRTAGPVFDPPERSSIDSEAPPRPDDLNRFARGGGAAAAGMPGPTLDVRYAAIPTKSPVRPAPTGRSIVTLCSPMCG